MDSIVSQWRMDMLFIETDIFTEDVKELLTDDDYREFQQFLASNPGWGEDDLSMDEKQQLRALNEGW